MENHLIKDVDATNSFVHHQYLQWYKDTYSIDTTPGFVLPVLHALQGHPEADVLWKVHAVNNKQGSSSVMNLNLLPTAHGQTMYRTTFGD